MKLYKPDSELPKTQSQEFDNWIQYLVDDKFSKDISTNSGIVLKIKQKLRRFTSGLVRMNLITTAVLLGVFSIGTLIVLISIDSRILLPGFVTITLYIALTIYIFKKNDPYVVEYFNQGGEGIDSDYLKHKLRMMMQHAEELIELGEFELAIKKLENLSLEFPNIWNVTYNLAFCYIKLGNYESSLELYHRLLRKIDSDHNYSQNIRYKSMVYNQIGNIHELKRDLKRAYTYFLNGYENEKDYFVTQLNLLSICLKLGKFEEAHFWFKVLKSKGNLHHINLISNESFRKLQDMPWYS